MAGGTESWVQGAGTSTRAIAGGVVWMWAGRGKARGVARREGPSWGHRTKGRAKSCRAGVCTGAPLRHGRGEQAWSSWTGPQRVLQAGIKIGDGPDRKGLRIGLEPRFWGPVWWRLRAADSVPLHVVGDTAAVDACGGRAAQAQTTSHHCKDPRRVLWEEVGGRKSRRWGVQEVRRVQVRAGVGSGTGYGEPLCGWGGTFRVTELKDVVL